jgi:release factor glutamine methyltransferase
VLGTDRTQLLAHDERKLTPEQLSKLNSFVQRRAKHEPLAYIRGRSEFYGREFLVNKHTLEPRPETETIITQLNSHLPSLLEVRPLTDEGNVNWEIIDVGTGSGCIAVTAKLEHPDAAVIGIDISDDCIKVARQNTENLGADVEFSQGDLLEPISKIQDLRSTVLLCNLPYVPDSHTINQAAMQEPRLAIFGGMDGLDVYRKLFTQIDELKHKPVYIFTESLPFQHHMLATVARNHGYVLEETEDFIQVYARN